MHMHWSMKHVPPLGGYGLRGLWEIEWCGREQCLSVLRYFIASGVFDKFCACIGWVDTITWGIAIWPCWNGANVDGERCQHWSHGWGIVGGKCILFNNSWMVAMWSGEHPLGLPAAYANKGVVHCNWDEQFLESWHGVPKCRILNVLVLWCRCVMGFDGWKCKKRIGMHLQLKWVCFECMKCIFKWAVHKMGHP